MRVPPDVMKFLLQGKVMWLVWSPRFDQDRWIYRSKREALASIKGEGIHASWFKIQRLCITKSKPEWAE